MIVASIIQLSNSVEEIWVQQNIFELVDVIFPRLASMDNRVGISREGYQCLLLLLLKMIPLCILFMRCTPVLIW